MVATKTSAAMRVAGLVQRASLVRQTRRYLRAVRGNSAQIQTPEREGRIMTTIHEMVKQVLTETGVAVTNKGVIAALELPARSTGRTALPDGTTLEAVVEALAKTNPLVAATLASASVPASPLDALAENEVAPALVDVQPVGDAETFFTEGLVRRPAAVVASELELTTAEVLVYAQVQVGDAASLVDPELVRKNLEATQAAEKIPASERPTGTSVFTMNIAQAAMVTSDHTRVGTRSKRTLREITEVAMSLQKLSVAIYGGAPFRPEPVAVSRIVGQAELVRTAPSAVPPNADTIFYEYESPLRKGWMV